MDRRQVLGITAGSLAISLGGCLGGDGNGGDGGDGDNETTPEDGSDDETNETTTDEQRGRGEPVEEMSDEEVAQQFLDRFLTILNEGLVERYNKVLHPQSDLEPIENEEDTVMGPQFDASNPEMITRTDEKLEIGMTMDYTRDGEDRTEDWQFEFRKQNEKWLLYAIDNPSILTDPAASPALAVQEFVTSLNEGDVQAVEGMLHEDSYQPETITENTGQWEGIVELENTSVSERLEGRAHVEATITVTHDEGQQELTWNLILVAVDREWKIGFEK